MTGGVSLLAVRGEAVTCHYCGRHGRRGFLWALAAGDELVAVCAGRVRCRSRRRLRSTRGRP